MGDKLFQTASASAAAFFLLLQEFVLTTHQLQSWRKILQVDVHVIAGHFQDVAAGGFDHEPGTQHVLDGTGFFG